MTYDEQLKAQQGVNEKCDKWFREFVLEHPHFAPLLNALYDAANKEKAETA
jgi:hypothetical protein